MNKTLGPARPTRVQTVRIAQMKAMITLVTAALYFPERIATKDFTVIACRARTEAHVKRRRTGQPSVCALQVTRVLTVPKTWTSAPARLVKTEAFV